MFLFYNHLFLHYGFFVGGGVFDFAALWQMIQVGHFTLAIFLIKSSYIFLRITNKRPMTHYRSMLRFTRIYYKSCAFIACFEAYLGLLRWY